MASHRHTDEEKNEEEDVIYERARMKSTHIQKSQFLLSSSSGGVDVCLMHMLRAVEERCCNDTHTHTHIT